MISTLVSESSPTHSIFYLENPAHCLLLNYYHTNRQRHIKTNRKNYTHTGARATCREKEFVDMRRFHSINIKLIDTQSKNECPFCLSTTAGANKVCSK